MANQNQKIECWKNNWPKLVAVLFLLKALFEPLHQTSRSNYHQLLTWIILGVSGYSVYIAYRSKRIGWAWTFLIIALLFDPIKPVHLAHESWQFIYFIAAIVFFFSLFANISEKQPKEAAIADRKHKIVMFEDEDVLLRMFGNKFKMEGFDFVGFEYPPEDVVDVIIREKPDIILSCVMMPHMDGLTLIQRLKQNDKTKNVPFVFFTNLHQEEDIRRGLALGAIEYLCKAETKPAEVVKKISSLLHS